MSKKTVKGWAIIYLGNLWSWHSNEREAKSYATNVHDEVVPCTITYEVPKSVN
jgi:hypothetical protein